VLLRKLLRDESPRRCVAVYAGHLRLLLGHEGQYRHLARQARVSSMIAAPERVQRSRSGTCARSRSVPAISAGSYSPEVDIVDADAGGRPVAGRRGSLAAAGAWSASIVNVTSAACMVFALPGGTFRLDRIRLAAERPRLRRQRSDEAEARKDVGGHEGRHLLDP
jgi:hypothetical protein